MGLDIGPLHVRRSILINAAPEVVWNEFRTTERLLGWLDRGHTVQGLNHLQALRTIVEMVD